jgi:nicotinate phosphoribosyltransferase
LKWLHKNGTFDGISIRAIPEGRTVHPNVPLTVVEGPLAMAQILETPLLNQLNYQTLIATKAARIAQVCEGQTVLEFGLRRAPERGAIAGARAALIGGASFTSNVGISHVLGLPPKGTHAHSMVQLFMALGEGELGAFRAYADVYPDDCLLLVDTINTLESGVPNAIRVFEELRRKGHKPVGIRLDSGDLAYLCIQAARMLDKAGFDDTRIVLSSQLDELVIWQIIRQIREEARQYDVEPERLIRRLMFGVGTRLITSEGQPALDGVYKLVAVWDRASWQPAIKVADNPIKTLIPGEKNTWRLYDQRNRAVADLMMLKEEDPRELHQIFLRHPFDHTAYRTLESSSISAIEPLQEEVLREGRLVKPLPGLEDIRAVRQKDVERLDPGVRRLINPHIYHVSVSERLWDLKQQMIENAARQDLVP